MSIQKKNVLKLCSFYVSDWHIVTMLLPYINKQINNNIKIIPILEDNIKENIEILINKLNLKDKEKILNINWDRTKVLKYSNINKLIKNNKEEESLIIIKGSKEYIEIVNKNIQKSIEKNKINKNIKIVDCYEVMEFNEEIQRILDSHDKILNTSGEKEIEDIFEGYKKIAK